MTAHKLTRRGSAYIIVLGSAMAVMVIGLSALTLVRMTRRAAQETAGFIQARFDARAAIEMGLHQIASISDWRHTFTNGVWLEDQPVGSGTYILEGVDPDDGDLADSDRDPLVLTGTGAEGDARFKLAVSLHAEIPPLDALGTAIHAGSITINGGKVLTATGAPVSANGLLKLDGGAVVTGDVEAGSLSNGGTISGTITVPSPAKDMPDAGVFATYAALATNLGTLTSIDKQVLAPGYNSLGPTNPDGVYFINSGGGTLTIQNSRINGTLIIQAGSGKVVIDKSVLIQNFRDDYPALIVSGNVELLYASSASSLSEASLSTNFNPLGAPYQGQSDILQDDSYPSEIQGLVHMTGTLRLKATARVRGVVICEGAVTADDDNEIVYEPDLYTNPPMGYTKPPVMTISEGSWRRIVD